jgi:hypothetical protein
MKKLLIIALTVVLAGGAMAQEWVWYGGAMGVYFSDTEFTAETTNLETTVPVFEFYIVLRDAQVNLVAAYECGLEFTDPTVFFLNATGPGGWTNFGALDNHLVGFQTPQPVDANGDVVLSTVTALYVGSDPIDLYMGPSSPSTGEPDHNPWGYTWNGPLIADGEDFDILLCCHLTSGAAGYPDVVATLNGSVVAVEGRSWSQVKGLFE